MIGCDRGGISFVLALRHSHPKLLLGGGARLKGYIIPPCTFKAPCPTFPPTFTVEHTKGHSPDHSTVVHVAAMEASPISAAFLLQGDC